jgi:tRNA A-37 threonylcarbamoyl transferase component Bud32
MTKRIIGGVSLTKTWKNAQKQDVLDYFLQNSDFKILTDTSVSCITYVATLREGMESPFFSIRSAFFQQPIRNLLLKVCIHNTNNDPVYDFRNENSNKDIERVSPENIIKEVEIQEALFRKSYIENVAEPICPAILYVQTDILTVENLQKKYQNWIISNLVQRNTNNKHSIGRDYVITNYLFNNYSLSIIFMEFAEGYSTLFDLWNQLNTQPEGMTQLNRYIGMSMYELYRLYHHYGIVHGDIHFGNVLIHPSFPNDTIGKVLLIDFGKSFYDTAIDKNKGEYDTVIYHQNTESFEIILRVMQNMDKNVYFRKIYEDLENIKKQKRASFLSIFFEGSLEKWKDWSENNIHFPFDSSLLGGSYHKSKSILVKESKVKSPHNKMNGIENTIPYYDSDRYIILDKKRDDFLPKMKYEFTIEDWNHAAERFIEGLKKTCENLPKVEPASPKRIAEAKKIISDALNAPLEIEHFQNPYRYPIGNPKKVAPIILPPSERTNSVDKKKNNRTKRNTF